MPFRTVLIASCLAACTATVANDLVLYQPGELPDPQDIAAMLRASQAPAAPIRTRSLKLLPETQPAGAEGRMSGVKPGPAGGPSAFALPVRFAFDSARILPEAHEQLDAVAEGIKLAGADVRVVIEGHTDAAGPADYNLQLSRRRANEVKNYLAIRHGIATANLRAIGSGASSPYNRDDPYAAENRRVEFRADR